MKNRKDTYVKSIKFILPIVCLVIVFFTESDIDWKNLDNNHFNTATAKTIIYDLAIGILSSMIIIWFIDIWEQRKEQEENIRKQQIVFTRLAPLTKSYYEMFFNLFIATSCKRISATSSVLKSVFNNKDDFYKQIIDSDPFYKPGYYGNPDIINIDFTKLTESEFKSFVNLPNVIWYKCIEIDTKKFLDELTEVNNFYKYFFPTDLFLKVEKIIPMLTPLSTISNFLEMRMVPNWHEDAKILKIPVKDFIEMIKLKDIIELLDEIIKIIETNSEIVITQKTIDDFNNRNTSPILGDARDYCEI